MCKKYSINNENEKEYRDYLNWLAQKPDNPYIDPDSEYKDKRSQDFYQDLCQFLNARECELEQKLNGKYKYDFDKNDKPYGVQVKEIIGKEEKLIFYLKSDQFGFSRPSEEQKYIYDIYLKQSKNKAKAINDIINWISNTRTLGGSFLWPMEKNKDGKWLSNPEYNKDRGGSKYGSKRYYIQDRSDLTLFEVKNLYSKYTKDKDEDGNILLYSKINKWSNMKKWLNHFRNFKTYVEFFGFKIDDETKSFVNNKNEVRNIFPFENKDGKIVEYFGTDFSINEYIEKYFKEFNIYNEKQDNYIDKIEKMLNLVTYLIRERSKWMEDKCYL